MRRLVAIVALGFVLAPAGVAVAQEGTGYGEEETPRGEIQLIDASEGDFDAIVAPGSFIRFKASGFMAESNAVLELHSEVQTLAFTKTDDAGNLDATVQIPEDATFGEHEIWAIGLDPDGNEKIVKVGVEIGDPEASSGNDWALPVGLIIAMVAIAAVAAQVVSRRRRPQEVRL